MTETELLEQLAMERQAALQEQQDAEWRAQRRFDAMARQEDAARRPAPVAAPPAPAPAPVKAPPAKVRARADQGHPSERTVQRRFKEGVSKGEDTNRPGLLASAEGGGSYTVVKGDNLWTIAKRMGVKLEDLVADNNIRNPNRIQPGQVLQLRTGSAPVAEAAPAATSGPNYVQQGIQARAGQGPRSFPQLAGELYDSFGNNPRNQETLESGGAFAGAVLGGATGAAVIPRLGGLLGGRTPAVDPRQIERMRDRMTLSPSTVRYRR